MKVIHLADLHLGKPFHKKSLIEDQRYMLDKVLDTVRELKAHLVISGDVFDSANPSIDAQELFVYFMRAVMKLCEENNTGCIVIVGNHDSNRRLALWRDLVGVNVFIVYESETIILDGVKFFALSFVKPSIAQSRFEREFDTYTEAFSAYLPEERKNTILLAHQTFEGCTTGSSEAMSFFDDAVSLDAVKDFPVVMAGHIHKRQTIKNVYYPGSLMPYAFGDVYAGGITVWNIEKNGDSLNISHEVIPIKLFREFKIVRGDLKHCLSLPDDGSYVKVELVDEGITLDIALPQLQSHFMNLVTAVSKITDDWEADLNKPIVQFDSIESALDSFCAQLEVPVFSSDQVRLVQEVVHEITAATD